MTSPATTPGPVPGEQALAYLDWAQERLGDHDLSEDPSIARRLMREESAELGGMPEPVRVVEELDVASIPVRVYRPGESSRDALLWIHGGGWMAGDIEGYDSITRRLANRSGANVISLDYRLAPEDPFPAGLDDCFTVLQWAATRFETLAVGGDSSGGNLAAATALRARDARIDVALQVLVYPILDYRPEHPSYADFIERYMSFGPLRDFGGHHAQLVQNSWETYLPDASSRLVPSASPLRADTLESVAPALFVLAEHDLLTAESVEYADRLRSDGVVADVAVVLGQVHGFFRLPGMSQDAVDAIDRIGSSVATAFSPQVTP